MNDNKFTTGLLLGLLLGGGAVFLLGTRTGKNLLKIVSEQGLDGLVNLLEEYGLNTLEEIEEIEEIPEQDVPSSESAVSEDLEKEKPEKAPKKHFFRRVKK
jgi:gas vesicle protein